MRASTCSISASDEMGALFSGFDGAYIAPGPSGLITRGRPDILPTGRNFYALDPQTIPTRAAWEMGKLLADKTLDRYLIDEGDYPENIAFYWQCTDIMWSDGEGMAQMMYLLGVKPVWQDNGRVKSFDVMSARRARAPPDRYNGARLRHHAGQLLWRDRPSGRSGPGGRGPAGAGRAELREEAHAREAGRQA